MSPAVREALAIRRRARRTFRPARGCVLWTPAMALTYVRRQAVRPDGRLNRALGPEAYEPDPPAPLP